MNENYHSSHGLSGTRRSLTSLQQRLVKTGGRSIKNARYYWLLLAESHQTRRLGAVLKLGRKSPDIARLADAQGRALLKPRLQFFEQSAKQFCSTMHRAARSDPGGAKQQNQTGVLFNRQEMH